MLWARAASMSFLTLGTVETQRGRAPQLPFMKSNTSNPVVRGSTVTGLSSGTGGGFTPAHSVVTSAAKAGSAPMAAIGTRHFAPDRGLPGCITRNCLQRLSQRRDNRLWGNAHEPFETLAACTLRFDARRNRLRRRPCAGHTGQADRPQAADPSG